MKITIPMIVELLSKMDRHHAKLKKKGTPTMFLEMRMVAVETILRRMQRIKREYDRKKD